MDAYLKGYYAAKEAGDEMGLKVYFGVEYTHMGGNGEDYLLLSLATSLFEDIRTGLEALQDAAGEWNLLCPLGAFGVYREGRSFYHRFTFPLSVSTVVLPSLMVSLLTAV